MASFVGHLYGGVVVSAAAALAIDGLGWAEPDQIQVLFGLGVVGGLLPDIDSDKSTPVRVLFTLLGVAAAFLASFSALERFEPAALALLWGAVFLLVRFGLLEIFAHLTVHRGIWHSLLAAAFVGLAIADAAHHLVKASAWESWLSGFFATLGYLTHLCLDEIASVDLLNNRVKRSFGTALKPFSAASPKASVVMLFGVLLLLYLAPTIEPVVAAVHGLKIDTIFNS